PLLTPSATPAPLTVGPTLALLTTTWPATTCALLCSRALLVAKSTTWGKSSGRVLTCVWASRLLKMPSAIKAMSATVKRLRRNALRLYPDGIISYAPSVYACRLFTVAAPYGRAGRWVCHQESPRAAVARTTVSGSADACSSPCTIVRPGIDNKAL